MLILVVICSSKVLSLFLAPELKNNHLPSSTEKVTKVCNPDGTWFQHPESNRVWTNYTQCQAYTQDKLKVVLQTPDALNVAFAQIRMTSFADSRCIKTKVGGKHRNRAGLTDAFR